MKNFLKDSAQTHSKFGGMWIDRSNFKEEVARRCQMGRLTPAQGARIIEFERDGYTIFPSAVPSATCDAVSAFNERLWRDGSDKIRVDLGAGHQTFKISVEQRAKPFKILDGYWFDHSLRDALFAAPVNEFINLLFDEKPMLFQSLFFERGTEQAIHQDTAYVVVQPSMRMVACWIALEDIQPGTGELEYYVGSHRGQEYSFSNGRKHWDPSQDGSAVHDRFLQYLHEEAAQKGFKKSSFLAKKGDVLVWHADLAHGGSKILSALPTRTSLVGHFCPASAKPNFFNFVKKPKIMKLENKGCFASWYYNDEEVT